MTKGPYFVNNPARGRYFEARHEPVSYTAALVAATAPRPTERSEIYVRHCNAHTILWAPIMAWHEPPAWQYHHHRNVALYSTVKTLPPDKQASRQSASRG
jgi:hypothetical protein